jgi:hypothetical protein
MEHYRAHRPDHWKLVGHTTQGTAPGGLPHTQAQPLGSLLGTQRRAVRGATAHTGPATGSWPGTQRRAVRGATAHTGPATGGY